MRVGMTIKEHRMAAPGPRNVHYGDLRIGFVSAGDADGPLPLRRTRPHLNFSDPELETNIPIASRPA